MSEPLLLNPIFVRLCDEKKPTLGSGRQEPIGSQQDRNQVGIYSQVSKYLKTYTSTFEILEDCFLHWNLKSNTVHLPDNVQRESHFCSLLSSQASFHTSQQGNSDPHCLCCFTVDSGAQPECGAALAWCFPCPWSPHRRGVQKLIFSCPSINTGVDLASRHLISWIDAQYATKWLTFLVTLIMSLSILFILRNFSIRYRKWKFRFSVLCSSGVFKISCPTCILLYYRNRFLSSCPLSGLWLVCGM